MSDEEEGGGGVVTTLVIVGAVGCGGLLLLGVVGAMFFGARVSVSPGGGMSAPVAVSVAVAETESHTITDLGNGNSAEEWTTLTPDGGRSFTRITTIAGVSSELRITFDPLDNFIEDESGLYEDGARVRALTDEERADLGG